MYSSREQELLAYIQNLEAELQKLKKQKKYGIVWEEKEENIDKNILPIVEEVETMRIEDSENKPYNLIIEGDNFHALSVLQNTHKAKIDVIYIDPPYNTGNKDFIYNDNYVDKEDTYRHSKWLSFMNKRLKLAKNLLKDDGVIFISIDDNEFAQLKLLCDEIFGERNFISKMLWKKQNGGKQDSKFLTNNFEYIFVYRKSEEKQTFLKYEPGENLYKFKDENGRLYNRKHTVDSQNFAYSKSLDYIIHGPNGEEIFAGNVTKEDYLKRINGGANKKDWCWTLSEKEFLKRKDEGKIDFLKNKDGNYRIYKRVYKDESDGVVYENLFDGANTGYGTRLLKNLFGEVNFPYPKPIELIKYLLNLFEKNIKILDFFAGSGTTGHAVLELNKEDGGKRQFILCSNTENTKENPDKNICKNITYERNKRVIQGYTNAKGEQIEGLGGNLRYYTTQFIPKTKSIDDLRYSFINKCDDLLCIKENTFTKMHFGQEIPELKIFKNQNHFTVILYDIFYFEETINILKSLAENKISLYVFSMSKEMFQEELHDFAKNITFENIPDEIMETYEKIFNF